MPQYLLSKWSDEWLDVLKQYNLGLDIRHTAITRDVVEAVHGAGQEVNCWTVDKPEDIKRMIDLKVDAIISNYPDRVLMQTRGYTIPWHQ